MIDWCCWSLEVWLGRSVMKDLEVRGNRRTRSGREEPTNDEVTGVLGDPLVSSLRDKRR